MKLAITKAIKHCNMIRISKVMIIPIFSKIVYHFRPSIVAQKPANLLVAVTERYHRPNRKLSKWN